MPWWFVLLAPVVAAAYVALNIGLVRALGGLAKAVGRIRG